MNISAKFQLHPAYGFFWGDDFLVCVFFFFFFFFSFFFFFFSFFWQIYYFGCHGNQSNSEVWTKFICLVEDYSRNISVKLLSKYLQWDSNKGLLSHFPLQVSGNFKLSQQRKHISNGQKKKTKKKKANVMNMSAKFQVHPTYGIWGEDFWLLSANLSFRLPRQPIKFNSLDKIHMLYRGLLKEYFCKTFVKISAVR